LRPIGKGGDGSGAFAVAGLSQYPFEANLLEAWP
jgi:hypothetical protein